MLQKWETFSSSMFTIHCKYSVVSFVRYIVLLQSPFWWFVHWLKVFLFLANEEQQHFCINWVKRLNSSPVTKLFFPRAFFCFHFFTHTQAHTSSTSSAWSSACCWKETKCVCAAECGTKDYFGAGGGGGGGGKWSEWGRLGGKHGTLNSPK